MDQEQLVYLKRYFHMAPPIWTSCSIEGPMKRIKLIIHTKPQGLLRNLS